MLRETDARGRMSFKRITFVIYPYDKSHTTRPGARRVGGATPNFRRQCVKTFTFLSP
jgi:hypothetical protein